MHKGKIQLLKTEGLGILKTLNKKAILNFRNGAIN